jgi:hypothetical protein
MLVTIHSLIYVVFYSVYMTVINFNSVAGSDSKY